MQEQTSCYTAMCEILAAIRTVSSHRRASRDTADPRKWGYYRTFQKVIPLVVRKIKLSWSEELTFVLSIVCSWCDVYDFSEALDLQAMRFTSMTSLQFNIRPFVKMFGLTNFSGTNFVFFVIISVITLLRKLFKFQNELVFLHAMKTCAGAEI